MNAACSMKKELGFFLNINSLFENKFYYESGGNSSLLLNLLIESKRKNWNVQLEKKLHLR